MQIKAITAKSVLVKSNLPASDYVANPYTGCTHRCRYCYASFMKRFSGHTEDWGTFIDVKNYESLKLPKNLNGKTVLLSSVTDPYNPVEKKFRKSREILGLLKNSGANIEILSKSDRMLEDLDLLKSIPGIRVGISLNTLDDDFRRDMEPCAVPIERRVNALKTLSENGISTYLFISPIFPKITDIREIVKCCEEFVDEICFENLNLRGAAKEEILAYIGEKFPQHLHIYEQIYRKGSNDFWMNMEREIEELSVEFSVKFTNYFYHSRIKKGAKND